MKQIKLFFSCGVLLLSGLVYPQASDTLRLATYNVRVDTSSDTGNRDWDMRKGHVADIIKNLYAFDIFGVQELTSSTQLNELMFYLSDTYSVYSKGIGNTEGSSGTRNAIVYKKSRLTLLNSGSFFLSETPEFVSKGWDAKLNRLCVWTRMLDNATNKQFYFFNAHFDHVGSEARRQSANLIVAKIAEINGPDNLPVFFVGDLNSQPDKIPISNILNGGLSDSRILPLKKNIFGPVGTTNGWNKDPASLANRIDYIFVNDKVEVYEYHCITKKYYSDAYPSDHLPIMIKAVLTNKVVIPGLKSNEILLGEYTLTSGEDEKAASNTEDGITFSSLYIAPDLLQASFENDMLHLTNWSTGFQLSSGKSVQFSITKNTSVQQFKVTRMDVVIRHQGSDGIVMHFGSDYNSGTRTTNLNTFQISKDSLSTLVLQEGTGNNVTPTPFITDQHPFYVAIGTRSPMPSDTVTIDNIRVYGIVSKLTEDFSAYDGVAVSGDITQMPRISNDVSLSKTPGWKAENTYAFKSGANYSASLLLGPTATDSSYITTPEIDLSQAFEVHFDYRSRLGETINPSGKINAYLNDSLLIWEGQSTQTTMEPSSSVAFMGTTTSKISFTVPTLAGNEMIIDNVNVVRSSQPALSLALHQTIDMGIVPLHQSKSIQIPLKAANLKRELSVNLHEGQHFNLLTPSEINRAEAEAGTGIEVRFNPPTVSGFYTDTIWVNSPNMPSRAIYLNATYDDYNSIPEVFGGEITTIGNTIVVFVDKSSHLQLFNPTGILIHDVKTNANSSSLQVPGAGCYILRITDKKNIHHVQKIFINQ